MLNQTIFKRVIPVFFVAALGLSACVNNAGEKQTLGALIGGGLGALAGSQIGSGDGQLAAVAIGTLLGAYAGSEVRKSLDRADQAYAEKAYQQAQSAQLGQSVSWNNPESGHAGSVTAVRDGKQAQTGAYCREFKTAVTIDSQTEEAFGTACQQADGSWKIVK